MQINMKVSDKLILKFWVCMTKQNLTRAIKYFSVAIALCFIVM